MAKFSVGEIAIITFSVMEQFPIGCEVEILDVLDPPRGEDGEFQYLIARQPKRLIYASDKCLRKKRPPGAPIAREEVGSWDLCPWRPETIKKQES
ncbi:MAG: hypothetical protein KGL39_47335 [Patescibacteria group bacterium]|nr:hypothetical protein [Patescibacteria group bacterium]